MYTAYFSGKSLDLGLQVLSEKGSELHHAVRKAESYEREARKLKYKLEEARRRGRR